MTRRPSGCPVPAGRARAGVRPKRARRCPTDVEELSAESGSSSGEGTGTDSEAECSTGEGPARPAAEPVAQGKRAGAGKRAPAKKAAKGRQQKQGQQQQRSNFVRMNTKVSAAVQPYCWPP